MECVIARCEVAGRPVVEPRRVDPLRLRVGDVLVLRFVYHVHERSRMQDLWRFTLQAECGSDAQSAAREHKDHFMVADQLESSLAVRLVMENEGTHDVRFTASAEMRSTPWVDDTIRADARRDRARGTVRVDVGDGSTRPS